jgi:hypothetical protein
MFLLAPVSFRQKAKILTFTISYKPLPERFPDAKVDIYAPGVNIAYGGPDLKTSIGNGSSLGITHSQNPIEIQAKLENLAAPQIAGLITYLYNSPHLDIMTEIWKEGGESIPSWPRVVKEYLLSLSYERLPGQDLGPVNVAYNGETPDTAPARCNQQKRSSEMGIYPRQNGTDESCPTTNSSISLPVYNIYPKVNVSQAIINAFTARLKSETNPGTLWTSGYRDEFVVFWAQTLTTEQVRLFETDPAVSPF